MGKVDCKSFMAAIVSGFDDPRVSSDKSVKSVDPKKYSF